MGPRRAEQSAGKPAAATQPDDAAQPGATMTGRHFRPPHNVPLWLKITAAAVAVVVLGGIAVGGFLLLRLQANVATSDLNAAVGPNLTTPLADDNHDPLQILILGTDTRDGSNKEYGSSADSTGNGNSDVMMLMNISADDRTVSILSFPRDLMVPIPACKDKTGATHPAQQLAQLNSALSEAGPGCTVAAINQLTGMSIDHFMLADFTAVKDLSNVIGGVQVCVNHRVNDFDGSGLILPAGKSMVQGEQALAFLRTRHSFGDASDLARIKAQQYFLGSMVRKIKSENTLSDLTKVYAMADAITKNLTIDKGLANIASMAAIAGRLKDVDPAKVAFVTVPNTADPQDPNRVVLSQPNAGNVFAAVRSNADLTAGTPSPAAKPTPSTGASAAATAPATPAPAPAATPYDKSLQPITILNGTGIDGRNTELIDKLTAAGFTNLAQDTLAQTQPTTKIAYGTDFKDVATDVAALFGIPLTALRSDATVNGVQLSVGTNFTSGTSFGKTELPKDIVSSTANQSGECLTVNPEQYPERFGK